jgi:uncharacterized protein
MVALLIGAFVASIVAAISGFGGAAILLPILVAVFGVRDAIPILTIAQLIGNGSRVWFNRRELDLRIVGWFALGAVPLAFVGGLLFVAAPTDLLTRMLGVFLLLTVAWRHFSPRRVAGPPVPAFAIIGAGFSFLSALVGSVGPVMAPFFLAVGLVKGAFIGTEALSTVVMHVTKLVAYGTGDLITAQTLVVGLSLGPLMIFGSYLGKRVVDRLSERAFLLIIDVVLVLAGLNFLVNG